jgi:hypothetical protein
MGSLAQAEEVPLPRRFITHTYEQKQFIVSIQLMLFAGVGSAIGYCGRGSFARVYVAPVQCYPGW